MENHEQIEDLVSEIKHKLDIITCFSRLLIVDLEQKEQVLNESYLIEIFQELENNCWNIGTKVDNLAYSLKYN
jgi:hypothetical protein